MACTNAVERAYASVGRLAQGAKSAFEHSLDVANGGVLWALPALLSNGLLRRCDKLAALPQGYYTQIHIFLLLAFMALCRIKTAERLRFSPPGELGKLIGLDRVPEVKTLREKVKILGNKRVYEWSEELCKDWMGEDQNAAGVLYVDGHVAPYHGKLTQLPRRYVARERLCLRGITDYWVNDQLGRPFFVVSTPLTSGLLAMMREDIVPRLLKDVPCPFSKEQLDENPLLHRFVMIFDREGYSPDFFRQMRDQRIACQTYHKFPGDDWQECEFQSYDVLMPSGEFTKMNLAERGTKMSNGMWMREIRKLSKSAHQIPVISSDYVSEMTDIAAHMFARWSQENFFKYMMDHFDIDRLAAYMTEAFDETKEVVHPAWRELDSQVRSKTAALHQKQRQFGRTALHEQLEERDVRKYESKKAELKEQIEEMEKEIAGLKAKRKEIPRKIQIAELAEEERFRQIAPSRKHFLDTIKMIAYRAETAMTLIVREQLARRDDARALLREIYQTNADLIPNNQNKTLTVRLHHLSNPLSSKAAAFLAENLNRSGIIYPGTDLRLVFEMVSTPNPPSQEV